MAHYTAQELPFSRIEIGDLIVLKKREWEVIEVRPDGHLAVQRLGRTVATTVDTQQVWTVHKKIHNGQSTVDSPQETVDTSDYITVQTYLLGRGMDPERLETAAKTFGTVLAAQYRKRYGKQAKAPTQLEYVHYLDTDGEWENACIVPAAREQRFGWYESRCYGPQDRDLMDAVADARHPGLDAYRDAALRAVDVLSYQFNVELESLQDTPAGQLLWLAEHQIQQCLASGVVCSHAECSRRRGKAWQQGRARKGGEHDRLEHGTGANLWDD